MSIIPVRRRGCRRRDDPFGARLLEPEHQSIAARCWLPVTSGAARFSGLPGVDHRVLGRNFRLIYEQANSHGEKVETACGNNMSSTDSAVGGSWA